MTQEDIKKTIKEVVGEETADLREEIKGRSQENQKDPSYALEIQKAAAEQKKEKQNKGLKAAGYIRALAACKGDAEKASRLAKDKWGDEELSKALAENIFESGGAVVPDEYVEEVVDLLRAQAVVRNLGARTMPMNSGSLTMPYLAEGASANYVGENKNIPASQQEFGQLQLSAKKLAALVPISNDLLRDASPQVDTIVRDDMVEALATREDLAFLRDDGTENKPKGMRYWADKDHVFNRSGSDLSNIVSDLGKCVRNLEEANIPINSGGWVMTPREKWYLMTLLDDNGNKIFWDEMQEGTLLTYPFRTTTQIPNNLSSPQANTTEIYFANFNSLVIGENTQLIVDVFEGGTYHDGSSLVSGISADQTVMRVLERHDFGDRRRGKSISVLQTDWGA